MKRVLMVLVVAAVAASAGTIGYLSGREAAPGGHEEEGKEAHTVATVKTATASMAGLGKTIVAYGTVRAPAEAVHVFSVPFEVRVRRLLVTPGQAVAAGTALAEIDPSPGTALQVKQARSNVDATGRKLAQAEHAAALQLQEARSTRDSAAKILAQTRRRLEMKLATNQEALQAQQEATAAQLRLEGLEKQEATPEVLQARQDVQAARLQQESLDKLGITNAQVKSEMAGVVNNLIAQEGQIVPAGGPLLELAEEKRIEAKLGVEPDDAAALQAGQTIRISPVQDQNAKPVEGRIRLITGRVNPASRLVEVFVSLPADAKLLLECYVRGRATVGEKQALVVPRAAVLPEEQKHVLFTLKDGKAVKHTVQTGIENDEVVEIAGGEIKPGDPVIIEGHYELQDGMAVEIEKPSDEKETPAPAQAEKAR